MLEHRVGEGSQVEVVAEELLWRHGLGDLDQRAPRAENQVERKCGLWLGELLFSQERVGERRAPKRKDQIEIRLVARPASKAGVRHLSPPSRSRYQSMVSSRPCSSWNKGRQPSFSRAFAALRYWHLISLVASSRTSGLRSDPMSPRILLVRSRTLIGSSLEKLNASPARLRSAARCSARKP